jgi:hypothetical protein
MVAKLPPLPRGLWVGKPPHVLWPHLFEPYKHDIMDHVIVINSVLASAREQQLSNHLRRVTQSE